MHGCACKSYSSYTRYYEDSTYSEDNISRNINKMVAKKNIDVII